MCGRSSGSTSTPGSTGKTWLGALKLSEPLSDKKDMTMNKLRIIVPAALVAGLALGVTLVPNEPRTLRVTHTQSEPAPVPVEPAPAPVEPAAEPPNDTHVAPITILRQTPPVHCRGFLTLPLASHLCCADKLTFEVRHHLIHFGERHFQRLPLRWVKLINRHIQEALKAG